jgi:hypothetical protein
MSKIIPKNTNHVVLEVSTERSIAEIQLEKLREIAMDRLLTPDETKQFDLLVKNIMLIRGQPTSINAHSQQVEQLSEAELVALAIVPEEDLVDNE